MKALAASKTISEHLKIMEEEKKRSSFGKKEKERKIDYLMQGICVETVTNFFGVVFLGESKKKEEGRREKGRLVVAY